MRLPPSVLSGLVVAAAIALLVGVLPEEVLSTRGVVRERVVVDGTAEEVFLYLADFNNTAQWDPGVFYASPNPVVEGGQPPQWNLITLWKGSRSLMVYERIVADPLRGTIILRGEGAYVFCHDSIKVSALPPPTIDDNDEGEGAESGGGGGGGGRGGGRGARTQVDYELVLQFKGPFRPFIGLIKDDLVKLGKDAMEGLAKACHENFGSSSSSESSSSKSTSSESTSSSECPSSESTSSESTSSSESSSSSSSSSSLSLSPESLEGPCTIQRLPVTAPLPTPLAQPAIFFYDSTDAAEQWAGVTAAAASKTAPASHRRRRERLAKFTALAAKGALAASALGQEPVRLTSSNTYSDGEATMPLEQYLRDLDKLSTGAGAAANETLYLFGGNYSPAWLAFLDEYPLPPCRTCTGEAPYKDNAAVSFGAGGFASGVSWHTHAGGFSETLHGRKRWFLLPPGSPTFKEIARQPNRSVAEWAIQDLPALRESAALLDTAATSEEPSETKSEPESPQPTSSFLLPQECIISPGELLYFPANWPHATLNLDAYTSFASTFLIEE